MQLRLAVAAAALAGLLSGPTVRSAEPVSPPSIITHVTLYGGRADVRREAHGVPLAAGDNRVEFLLPGTLIESTPRASASGPGVRVVNVEVRAADAPHPSTVDAPRIAELEAEAVALEAELAGLAAGSEFLKAIRPDLGEATAAAVRDTASWGRTVTFLSGSVRSNRAATDRAKARVELVRAEIARLREHERRATSGVPPRPLVVEIRADAAASADLVLEYAVHGASWRAEYDVDLAEDFKSVDLVYYGVLTQATGEDWDSATVVLATRQPSDEFRARRLEPWQLKAAPPPEPVQMPPAARRLEKEESGSVRVIDSGRSSKIRAINTTEEAIATTVMSGGLSASFEIAEPILLPSDGSPRRLRIAAERLEAAVRHEALPAFGDRAFLVADLRNSTGRPLLPGRTRVTMGGAFLGNGAVEEVAPDQKVTLALGVDPYVRVEQSTLERSESAQGDRRRSRSRDRIEVSNHRTRPVDIVLRDRIPVSIDREVDVRTIDTRPDASPDEEGILEWKFSLGPGETWRAEKGYEVRYPAGRRPANL